MITWDAVPRATKYTVILSRLDGTVSKQVVKENRAEFPADPRQVRKIRVQPNVTGAEPVYYKLA